jgi:hypothetical protein
MKKVINVLLFEEDDAVFQQLKQQCLLWAPNCVITRAKGRKMLELRLKWMRYSLVLARYSQFSLSAIDLLFYLKDVQAHCSLVFILDEACEYNNLDTSVMRHAAACLYSINFQRKSFLLEEALRKSMPKFNVQLMIDRKLLEQTIRQGRANYQDENHIASIRQGGNCVLPTSSTLQSGKSAGAGGASVSSLGNRDSDTSAARGEDPRDQLGVGIRQGRL